MKFVEPKVYKIGETSIRYDALRQVMSEFGPEAEDWLNNKVDISYTPYVLGNMTEGELLIETAGRICYKSYAPGLNPNVTKIREDSKEYFENVLKKGDGSILEHSQISFAILNVSRVFTHELVRHRVGVAYSQESQRYVRPIELLITTIDGKETPEEKAVYESIESMYNIAVKNIDWDKLSFDEKKRQTSRLRRKLPNGIATNIIFTANLRALRWLIEARTDPGAEIEIRYVFNIIAEMMIQDYPLVFGDFEKTKLEDGTFSYKPKLRSKV
jgi:thymidylate synthase (FAD)